MNIRDLVGIRNCVRCGKKRGGRRAEEEKACVVADSPLTLYTFQNPFANIELDGLLLYYCRFAIFCFSFALQSRPQFGIASAATAAADTGTNKTSTGNGAHGSRGIGFRVQIGVNFPSTHIARTFDDITTYLPICSC